MCRLLILVVVAVVVCARYGSATHFTLHNMMPTWNWDTVNFWSQIAFAFTGLELVSCMGEEVHNPRRTLPRAVFGAGALIALMYIAGTFAVLALAPAGDIDPKSGVFQCHRRGLRNARIGFIGVIAAILVTAGNAGGVGTTVAGVARVPFQVGIDRYLPAAFGKIHPRWKTPYISILVQAIASVVILFLARSRIAASSQPTRCWSTRRSSSISFRFSTCLPQSSNWPIAPTAKKSARSSCTRRKGRRMDLRRLSASWSFLLEFSCHSCRPAAPTQLFLK